MIYLNHIIWDTDSDAQFSRLPDTLELPRMNRNDIATYVHQLISYYPLDYVATTIVTNIQWDIDSDDYDDEVLSLPNAMEVPCYFDEDGDMDFDAISDHISDVTGFCHYGFSE